MTLDADIEAFEQERSAHNEAVTNAEREVEEIRTALAAEEAKEPKPGQAASPAGTNNERSENTPMNTRQKFFGMNTQERDAFLARDDVKSFLTRVREMKGQTREITGKELLIPDVMLGLIRENITEFSKLYKHVNVQRVSGASRQVIAGTIPEAVWTEMCAKINEVAFNFAAVEMDGYKVGAFIPCCNALLEDNDINLAAELIRMLGRAIGYALDKAILYGTGTKMPLGIVTRLCQTAQPAGYSTKARTWADLHTSNVVKITGSGAAFFGNLVKAAAKAKGKYSAGARFWAMNETTHAALIAEAVNINAAGAIVSGVNNTMPVVGGAIEILDFLPDGVMVTGYGDLYPLAERAGLAVAPSEHVRFLEDQTVFKATARYDGQPAIAEGFAVLYTGNTAPTAGDVTFAADTANAVAGGEG